MKLRGIIETFDCFGRGAFYKASSISLRVSHQTVKGGLSLKNKKNKKWVFNCSSYSHRVITK